MDKLLHHYERELSRLREATRQYAAKHPDTAAALELGRDASTDPEVERLLQSVALLNAATQQLIEDGRGEFHKALLQTLQPHYLQPLPACGIASIDTSKATANEISTVTRMPRGTVLRSGTNRFTTTSDTFIAPLAIAGASFHPTLDLPPSLRLPGDATCALSIAIETTSNNASFDQPPLARLRVHVHAEPALRAALLDAILMNSLCTCIECGGSWRLLSASPFAPVGEHADDSLLPPLPGAQSPRLLTEFFHLPQKFSFIDLDLANLLASCPPACKRIALHVILPSCDQRLRGTSAANFRLSCTPVINLFHQTAAAIRLDGRSEPYPITTSQPGGSIHSIDSVAIMSHAGDRFLPAFHGTEHTDHEPYWQLDDQEGLAIRLVDREQRPFTIKSGTLTVQVTCTNSDTSHPPARLTTESSAAGFPIEFLCNAAMAAGVPNAAILCGNLYDEDTTLPKLRKLLETLGCKFTNSLKALVAKPATAWLEHPMGRVHMRGTEFTIVIDEAALKTHSIHVFAEILACTLADKLRANRFAQLRLTNENGMLLYAAAPRVGTRSIS